MSRRLPIILVSAAVAMGAAGCDLDAFLGSVATPTPTLEPTAAASPTPTPHPDHLKYVQGVRLDLRKDEGSLHSTYTSDYFDIFTTSSSDISDSGHFRVYFQEKNQDNESNGHFIWNNKGSIQKIEYINRGFFDFMSFDEAPENGWGITPYLDRKVQKTRSDELILFRLTDVASSSVHYGKIRFKELTKEKAVFDYILNTKSGDRQL
ncbi:hypothetical protein D3C87_655930 [compost metagenome]